jgi:hypothetical protein
MPTAAACSGAHHWLALRGTNVVAEANRVVPVQTFVKES